MVLELTKENFNSEVKESNIPVIIDFWAPWCGPCQTFGPIFESISKEFEGKIKFAKVNTEEQPELAAEFEIRSIPAIITFNQGKEINRDIGALQEQTLKQKVESLL
jgi:thioredoxin